MTGAEKKRKKLRETEVTIEVRWLGKLTATMSALNTIAVMADATHRYSGYGNEDSIEHDISSSIYEQLKSFGLYDGL